MKEMRRVLALVLCLVMLIGIVPAAAFATESEAPAEESGYTDLGTKTAAEGNEQQDPLPEEIQQLVDAPVDAPALAADGKTPIDAALFFADLHTNEKNYKDADIKRILGGLENFGMKFSTVNSVGDAFSSNEKKYTGYTSTITKSFQEALGYSDFEMYYVWTDHDRGADIDNFTGLLYGDESTNYYLYTISMSDMSSSERYGQPSTFTESKLSEFTAAVEAMDHSKPLFILSHMPLHDRRGDNQYADEWYGVISAAAEKMDIAFFWGHNHTQEPASEQAAYYVAKNGTETMLVEGMSNAVTPNFTYLCAGYMSPASTGYTYETTRQETVVAVTLYEDQVVYTLYDEDGVVSGNFALNETVTRDHAAPAVTLTSIAVTTEPTTVEYTVGDTFSAEGLVVTGTYSDGTTAPVTGYTLSEVDMTTAGEKEVTVTYESKTATFKITVRSAEPTVNTVECWDDTEQVTVKATGLGLTAVEATNVTGENEKCDEIFTEYGYVAFDIALTGLVEGESVKYSISVVPDLDTTNLELYYIDENGDLIPVEYKLTSDELGNAYVEFTADHDGVFVYGSPVVPEGYVLTSLAMANIPRDVFLNGSLDLLNAEITATYTMEGAEDFVRKLTAYDYDETNFSGYDVAVAGAQTVVFTFEGLTATYEIFVWSRTVSAGEVSVELSGAEYGVTAVNVAESTNPHVAEAVANVMSNYVAYDISLAYAEGYAATEDTKTVTLPIPEGVVNPVVYYVSDNGYNVVDMNATANEDGTTVSFTTTHFSTYVVGEGTTITVPDEETATGSSTIPGEKKTVYVLASTPSDSVLIVNGNSAGSGYYAVANNNGSVAATDVTIKSGDVDGDGDTETYIELDDAADELWTVAGSYTFECEDGYLYRASSSGGTTPRIDDSSTTWSYNTSNHRLSYTRSGSTYYLYYSRGWKVSTSSSNAGSIYFYVPQKIDTTTTVSGTYSIAGTDETVAAIKDSTFDLTSTLVFTPTSGEATTTVDPEGVTYEKYEGGDPLGVISGISGNTVTLSGKVGKALVKVSYTTDFGEVTDYITVTASQPHHYSIQLHLNEGGTLGDEITEPVARKGVKAGDTYSVWAVVKAYASAEDTVGVDIGRLGDALHWDVSDKSIADIDTKTGVITFTGEHYGTFDVTVSYEGADGKVITDTIIISATDSLYVVPGDGTDDFPEYPAQGSVRFDKTATAVGNYSQTGIAKVELSMTGVPYTSNNRLDVVLMLDRSSSMYKSGVQHRISSTVEATKAFIKSIVMNEDGSFNNNRILVLDFLGGNLDSSEGGGSSHKFQCNQYTSNEENGYQVIGSQAELDALLTKVETDFKGQTSLYGTEYAQGLEKCYTALQNSKADGNKQFCVFMSDGIPNYLMGEKTHFKKTDDIVATFDVTNYNRDTATVSRNATKYEYEHYSTLMKNDGVTVYTVGLGLKNTNSAWSNASKEACEQVADMLLNDISGPAGETTAQRDTGNAVSKKGTYFFSVADDNAAAEMDDVFAGIATKILEAAKNVVVEDKIGENYTLNFKLPNSNVTAEETGMSEFYIRVVEYQLDANKERAGDPAVLENFTFDANGAMKTHTVDGVVTCQGTDCGHVEFRTGRVVGIDGTYFEYTCGPALDANGQEIKDEFGNTKTEEFLTWNADKLTTTELVMEYFAYLDNSAGLGPDQQVPAGTYYTNEYATLTYDNVNGNRVQQEFPIPQMTWKGAEVTYVFYLVNEAGQPVNRAGRVIPFAESFYVTDPVTFDVHWNEETGSEKILAHDIFATAGVPDVYKLYDENAQYVIRVYQTEGVDSETSAVNYNYFQISGSTAITNQKTTKVFNTKAGNRYDDYGVYSAQEVGTTLSTTDAAGNATTVTTTDKVLDIDYANTTVAFAVVWKPELVPDTVVIDYGLDVVIDVIKNDSMAAGVVGVRADAPANTDMNSGTYSSAKAQTADIYIDSNNDDNGLKELKIGTAKVENMNQVRFTLDKTNGMQFTDPAVFYYEADVNYYDKDGNLQSTSMYSSVTVIPATTVYYEDEYVKLRSFVKDADGKYTESTDASDKVVSGWDKESVAEKATQAVDRPGENKIGSGYDSDNIYGYDPAYANSSTYSLGDAAMVNVNSSKYATATFEFFGTGFDIISMTSNTTGTILLKVYPWNGTAYSDTASRSHIVDTYWGYSYVKYLVTYTYNAETKEWVRSVGDVTTEPERNAIFPDKPVDKQKVEAVEGTWVVTNNNPEGLYQVPVMKVDELTYGRYKAEITVSYAALFDHTEADGYDFYLDAIRIYDPCGLNEVVDDKGTEDTGDDVTVGDIYGADGEFDPTYVELRNKIISAQTFGSFFVEAVDITAFADGLTYYTEANGEYTIAEEFVEGTKYYTMQSGIEIDGMAFTASTFIDGKGITASIADYTSYGPNNEVYLTPGQAVAAKMNAAAKAGYKTHIHLGIKSVGGDASVEVYSVNANNQAIKTVVKETLTTATDMYYDISDLNGQTIVITNGGTGILSITNVKVAYEKDTDTTAVNAVSVDAAGDEEQPLFAVNSETLKLALLSLREPVEVEKPAAPEGGESGGNEPGGEPEGGEPGGNEPGGEPEGGEPGGNEPGGEPEGGEPGGNEPGGEPEGGEPGGNEPGGEPGGNAPQDPVPSEPVPEETEPEEKESVEETIQDIVEIIRDIIGIIGGMFRGWF